LAADKLGATKMDRPEWAAVHPVTGEVYFTLTNNRVASRPIASLDAANPRAYEDARTPTGSNTPGNVNGHIIRWRELGDDPAATTFNWDIYVFGAQADADPNNVNISALTADNDFSSPDGLWFGRETNTSGSVLWIQTDDGAYTDVTNCMLLAAIPGAVGDGVNRMITSTLSGESKTITTKIGKLPGTANLLRFLVGPKQCEITGIDSTPDGKVLFVNIQHPGEDTATPTLNFGDPNTFGSRWPGNQFAATRPGNRPRSATLVITKADGGVVGL
ncbi:MAG: PhoX family protein, partial [Nevskiales bacterium]